MYLHVLGLLIDFLVLLVFWSAVCAFIAWTVAKVRNRPVVVYMARAGWIALVVAVLGTVGTITPRYQRSVILPTSEATMPATIGHPTPGETDFARARRAHRALQQEVAAHYSLILQWSDDAVTYAQYLERSQVALTACDEAVVALRNAATALSGSDDPLIPLVLEAVSIKESQVYCLRKLHEGIVQIENGATQEGVAVVREYDTRFVDLQRRYEALGARMVTAAER